MTLLNSTFQMPGVVTNAGPATLSESRSDLLDTVQALSVEPKVTLYSYSVLGVVFSSRYDPLPVFASPLTSFARTIHSFSPRFLRSIWKKKVAGFTSMGFGFSSGFTAPLNDHSRSTPSKFACGVLRVTFGKKKGALATTSGFFGSAL